MERNDIKMKQFRIEKLKEAILTQSRLPKDEADTLAKTLAEETNWDTEFNYQKIVYHALEASGLLRTQSAKSCKIRKGSKIN